MHFSTVMTAAFTALSFSTTALGLTVPTTSQSIQSRADSKTSPIPFPFDEAHSDVIEHAFSAITSIPDSVLDDGPEALKAWITAHEAKPKLTVRVPTLALEPRQSLFHILQCAGAIIKAIAENAFPISKLRRLKELIEILGGARKVAKLLLKAKTFHQILVIGGPELEEIAEILLGITDVVNDCFSF